MIATKHLFETTFIINAALEDPPIESIIASVQDFITKNGGEIKAVNKWGRKRMTHSIKKKNNGFYTNIEFLAPGSLISQLERTYQLEENILRYLTIKVDKRGLVVRTQLAAGADNSTALVPDAVKAPLFEGAAGNTEE